MSDPRDTRLTPRGTEPPLTLLVDAVNAGFGGIATYVVNLLEAWPLAYPGDVLHVVAPTDVLDTLPDKGIRKHHIAVPRPAPAGRPLAQTYWLRRLARQVHADAALVTLPSTTLLALPVPTLVTIYDLRHELRPEQFTRRRRLMRRLSYGRGYAIADGFAAISRRSLDDLHERHPRTVRKFGTVVHLAADHVEAWPAPVRGPYALAFGHHTNKNVTMLLDAWVELAAGDAAARLPPLRITGLQGPARDDVLAAVAARGLDDRVELMPFLSDRDFARAFVESCMIVFPSDFEGFGLPVIEAMRLRKPIVVGPERAVLEVAGGHATVMAGWNAAALAAAVVDALDQTDDSLQAAADHAQAFTWRRCAAQTRAALLALPTG